MNQAVGLVEVFGMATALYAADAACKAANVTIEAFDSNKPANADNMPVPLLVLVKVRGSVSDVREAVEAAKRAANEISGVNSSYVIPSPDPMVEKMLQRSCL